MVRAAQQYAHDHLNTEMGNAYLYVLLREYAKLQRFKPRLDAAYRRGRIRLGRTQFVDFVRFTGLRACPYWSRQ